MDLWAYYVPAQGLSLLQYASDATSWGVHLLTGGVELMAQQLVDEGLELSAALRTAALVLILHEHFHHAVAAASAMLTRIDSQHSYEAYRRRVDQRNGYFPLEEAIANAHALRHLDGHERLAVAQVMRRQPSGYKEAEAYLDVIDFDHGCSTLVAEVAGRRVSDLQAHQRILLDTEFRLIDLSTAPMHLVESRGSSHELGEWRLAF